MKILILLSLIICFSAFSQKKESSIRVNVIDQDTKSYNFKSVTYPLKGTVGAVSPEGKVSPMVAVDLKPTTQNIKPDIVWTLDLQMGTVSVLSNTSQIPSETGTEIQLDEVTAFNYRIYLSALIKNKHQIRLLYAPLSYESSAFIPSDDILFNGVKFMAGVETLTNYKFNSYRLTYIYHFNQSGKVQFRLGFSAKIRDAFTEVKQNGQTERFENIGFVPLIHLGAIIHLNERNMIDIDIEGSWAPQGYALDARFSFNRKINKNLTVGLGAGFLDGGANVESVKTFTSAVYGFGRIVLTIP